MQQQEEEEEEGPPAGSASNNIQTLQKDERKLPPVVQRLEKAQKEGVTDNNNSNNNKSFPICVIVVGMAGSGKTTLMSQLQRSLDDKYEASKQSEREAAKGLGENDTNENDDNDENEDDYMPAYCINLDPATLDTPYDVSIDIRDTVNYKQVMELHQLGPNGAIMTCLNLFATKFDQVLNLVERRAFPTETTTEATTETTTITTTNEKPMEYILVDTPGQIEAFTWSASGQIISEALASALPTVLCFVVDTARCAASPNTFMSNMLYACSMLYRTRLPLVVCFNKIDVVSHEFCLDWMRDYEAFQQALDDNQASSSNGGFYSSLTRSLSLVLDEFYSNFANAVGVSAVTGDGMDDFWNTVQKAANKDFMDYVADLKLRFEEQQVKRRAIAKSQVQRLQRDINME